MSKTSSSLVTLLLSAIDFAFQAQAAAYNNSLSQVEGAALTLLDLHNQQHGGQPRTKVFQTH